MLLSNIANHHLIYLYGYCLSFFSWFYVRSLLKSLLSNALAEERSIINVWPLFQDTQNVFLFQVVNTFSPFSFRCNRRQYMIDSMKYSWIVIVQNLTITFAYRAFVDVNTSCSFTMRYENSVTWTFLQSHRSNITKEKGILYIFLCCLGSSRMQNDIYLDVLLQKRYDFCSLEVKSEIK